MSNIVRMQELSSIYRTNLRIKESPQSTVAHLISHTSSMQIKFIIAKEIVQLERVILSELDSLLYGPGKIGKEKPLAFWVCLCTLILSYKSHGIYLKADIMNPGIIPLAMHTFQPINLLSTDHSRLYDLAQHIYNNLTSIYDSLYKRTSPLTLDWRKPEVAELLGKDQKLIRLFCDIKTEMFWFRKYSLSYNLLLY
jgi:hypothetical protein